MRKEKTIYSRELENYESFLSSKSIINFFIENKLYIIIPLAFYGILCFLTLLGILTTMSGVKYEKICFSNHCLGTFKKDFGNIISFHLSGAEYIMWLTTILSLIVAIYSYVISVKVSLTTLSNENYQKFKDLLDNSTRADGDIKNYHINYHKLYDFIYENADEGDFSVSEKYLDSLKRINFFIKNYSTDKASRTHDEYAKSIIDILTSFGFNIKNRGRRYFHSDELIFVKFINEINKVILKENKLKIIERALR